MDMCDCRFIRFHCSERENGSSGHLEEISYGEIIDYNTGLDATLDEYNDTCPLSFHSFMAIFCVHQIKKKNY